MPLEFRYCYLLLLFQFFLMLLLLMLVLMRARGLLLSLYFETLSWKCRCLNAGRKILDQQSWSGVQQLDAYQRRPDGLAE